jgi:hypothetical protein
MIAQKSAEAGTSNIVVTGTRSRPPAAWAERDELAGAAASDSSAPDWVLRDRSFAAFLTHLQEAVRKDDRDAVIRLSTVPLRVDSGGRMRLYPDVSSIRADFDRIFTPRVKAAILRQQFDRLTGQRRVVIIGAGEVRFGHSCSNHPCSGGPVRIVAVNP